MVRYYQQDYKNYSKTITDGCRGYSLIPGSGSLGITSVGSALLAAHDLDEDFLYYKQSNSRYNRYDNSYKYAGFKLIAYIEKAVISNLILKYAYADSGAVCDRNDKALEVVTLNCCNSIAFCKPVRDLAACDSKL